MDIPGTDNRRAGQSTVGKLLPDLGRRTLVMGILNLTPNSFSDGGLFNAGEAALAHAVAMVEEGADIVDIGGESTRPGSTEVSAEDEAARVLPILARCGGAGGGADLHRHLQGIHGQGGARGGARIVNDVWGLQREPEIAQWRPRPARR